MPSPQLLRQKLRRIIVESDTPAGRRFDIALIVLIVASIAVEMADSVQTLSAKFGPQFNALEWLFTAAFTAEYAARLYCSEKRWAYARSFYGIVDFCAAVPTWLSFFFPGLHALIDIRVLRLLRVFRLLKLVAYVGEYAALAKALRASKRKILVFLSFVVMIVVVLGTLMFVIEGPGNGFTSIPASIYLDRAREPRPSGRG